MPDYTGTTQTRNGCSASSFRLARNLLFFIGARTRTRTGMALRPGDFKSHASTDFAIRAGAKCRSRGIVEEKVGGSSRN